MPPNDQCIADSTADSNAQTRRVLVTGALQLMVAAFMLASPPPLRAAPTPPVQIEWSALLPISERYRPALPPSSAHNYLGEGDTAALQSGSAAVNPELDGRRVRIPGFVVPLTYSADRLLESFLLVPYFGACIHFPPPPPNQVILVQMRRGKGLRSIEDAQWVTGTLRAGYRKSDLGAAAYFLDGEALEPYSP